MKRAIIDLLKKLGLERQVYWLYVKLSAIFWNVLSFLTARNKRFADKYLSESQTRKLHLGCGSNYLKGWLNTDIYPNAHRIYLDITKKFTLPENSFDYVYTEHVIEHMPFLDGKNMIEQSFKTLKPGGSIRVVTPDIRFLIALYQNDQEQLHKDYIAWNSELFIKNKAPHCALSVLNNYVRDWGHVFIYDVPLISEMLKEAGFTNIRECKLCESSKPDLQDLENVSRHPEGFLALESLVVEADKPT